MSISMVPVRGSVAAIWVATRINLKHMSGFTTKKKNTKKKKKKKKKKAVILFHLVASMTSAAKTVSANLILANAYCMNEYMYVCMYVYMYVFMYVFMYV